MAKYIPAKIRCHVKGCCSSTRYSSVNNLFDEVFYNKTIFLDAMSGEERNTKLSISYEL